MVQRTLFILKPDSLERNLGGRILTKVEDAGLRFRRMEIVPLLDLFIGKLNSSDTLLRLFDEHMSIDYELSGLIDVEQKWKDIEGLVKNGGLTMNEAREQLGMPRVDDPLLDQYFTDQNRVPVALAGLDAPDELGLRMLHSGLRVAPDYEEHGHSKQS